MRAGWGTLLGCPALRNDDDPDLTVPTSLSLPQSGARQQRPYSLPQAFVRDVAVEVVTVLISPGALGIRLTRSDSAVNEQRRQESWRRCAVAQVTDYATESRPDSTSPSAASKASSAASTVSVAFLSPERAVFTSSW